MDGDFVERPITYSSPGPFLHRDEGARAASFGPPLLAQPVSARLAVAAPSNRVAVLVFRIEAFPVFFSGRGRTAAFLPCRHLPWIREAFSPKRVNISLAKGPNARLCRGFGALSRMGTYGRERLNEDFAGRAPPKEGGGAGAGAIGTGTEHARRDRRFRPAEAPPGRQDGRAECRGSRRRWPHRRQAPRNGTRSPADSCGAPPRRNCPRRRAGGGGPVGDQIGLAVAHLAVDDPRQVHASLAHEVAAEFDAEFRIFN